MSPNPLDHRSRRRGPHGGESFKAITKARNAIRMGYPSGLDEWQKEALAQELEVLRDGIDKFLAQMEGM